MDERVSSLETLQDIKKIMDRSSRFISLSGLTGVAAGVLALVASYLAYKTIENFYVRFPFDNASITEFRAFVVKLILIAAGLLLVTLTVAFYLTWRKAVRDNEVFWNKTSRRLLINLFIPIVAGAALILGMLYNGIWQFVVPASLLFYGLGLVNASKYTFSDIRYLGLLELITGTVSMFFLEYGIYFWAFGFGILHIVYGVIMWFKYER